MNRHLVVVELDARLFTNPGETAGYIERAVAHALQRDGLTTLAKEGLVDFRPVVTCIDDNAPLRYCEGEPADRAGEDEWDGSHLGIASNATLIEELSHRAELGDTDRGLDYRPRVTI